MKKVGIVLLVVVIIVAAIAVYAPARNWVIGQFNAVKDAFKSDEEKDAKRKQQITQDDRYKELDADNKKEFDDKFNQIIGSDEYKDKTDKEKDDIIEKLVESEKLQQDVEKEQEEYDSRKEENKQQLEDLTNSQQELEQRVQDLKNSGASDEEIKAAEEEQQKVEEQIKAAKQEKIYFDTVDVVDKTTSENIIFKIDSGNARLRKINGIYSFADSLLLINADFVRSENICGVEICSTINQFIHVAGLLEDNATYEQIYEMMTQDNAILSTYNTCVNINAREHKDLFNENIAHSDNVVITNLISNGYTNFEIAQSWEQVKDTHPNYIFVAKKSTDNNASSITYMANYDGNIKEYSIFPLEKICPEFWAQVEAEQAKQTP